MKQHSLVGRLDRRERKIKWDDMINLVESLVLPGRDGWVPRHVVLRELGKDFQYGYTRGEHEYWLEQAIFRKRILEQSRKGRRGQLSVRVQQA